MKLLYLVLNHAADQWKRPPREWFEAKAQFAVVFARGSSPNDENRPRAQNIRQSLCLRKATLSASSSIESTVERTAFGPSDVS